MKAYFINLHPSYNIGYQYISLGNSEKHALARLSIAVRRHRIICRAHVSVGDNRDNLWGSTLNRCNEVLNIIRRPHRFTHSSFGDGKTHPKVEIKEIVEPLSVSYVKEVWLDRYV